MRMLPFGALVALLLCTPLAAQEPPVVSAREMDAALEARGQQVDTDRAVIARVLARADVETAATSAGFGDALSDARAAVDGLEGEGLTRAAGYARALEQELAGGQTITFSAVTIIIILLLVILIILIAD